MNIIFVLVNPARPENVGFAARAIKTMGFHDLRVVGSPEVLTGSARKTAYGSHDLLESARVFSELTKALKDLDLVVGTTAKKRTKRVDYHKPGPLVSLLQARASVIDKCGIIFGSEESGLSTDQLDQCDLVSTIPLKTKYPSLNLAQSVLIYAWELRRITLKEKTVTRPNSSLQSILKTELEWLMHWLELDRNPLLTQRIHDRLMTTGSDDVRLMLSVISKLRRKDTAS